MEASLVVCILAALLATGTCLQCEVCAGVGNNCKGSMQTCAAGQDSCAILLTEVIVVGIKRQSVHKGCVTSSQCKADLISMNFGSEMTTRTSVTCCMGDACRTDNVTLPPADTKPNGRRCRGCYAMNTDHCNEQTIACTGNETQCINSTGTITIGGKPTEMVMKGCVSASVCPHLKVGSSDFTGISFNLTNNKCTEASDAAGIAPGQAGLLLTALAGLLLLKLLS